MAFEKLYRNTLKLGLIISLEDDLPGDLHARIGQVSFRNYLPSKTICLSLTTERDFFFEPCKFNSWVFRVNLSFLRKNASIQLNDEPLLPSSHKFKLLTCLLLCQIISPNEWQAGVQVAYLNYGPVIVSKYVNCAITLSKANPWY